MKLNITKAAVEALPPASGKNQELYYDTRLPGFGVYVIPKGVKTYFVEGTVGGVKTRRKIGRHGVIFPDVAREEARWLLLGMAKGESPIPEEKRTHTLADAVSDYLKERCGSSGKQIKQKTKDGYQWLLDVPLKKWKGTPVGEFDKLLIRTIHKEITDQSGPVCANNCLRMVRAVFNFNDVEPNLVDELSKKRLWNPERRRSRYIESVDVSHWIKNAEALGIIPRCAILMMLLLGLRKMEVLTLRKSQIRNGAVYLDATKNGEDHMVPFGPYMAERLELLMNIEGQWLFPSSWSKTGHMSDPRKAIASLGKDLSPHDLRRTFVSHLNALEPAPSAYTIKRLMNHRQSSSDVTAGYIQIEERKLREVITRLEKRMVTGD